MKINHLLHCFILCLAATGLSAQGNTESPEGHGERKHHPTPFHFEVGANALQLGKAIQGTATDTSGLNPWLVDGRLSYRGIGIRGSFGGTYKKEKSFIPGFKDSETHTVSSFNYRAGINYRAPFNRRFRQISEPTG